MAEELNLIAKKAVKRDALLKVMAWGEPGSGKTRLALSFPSPIVADLERSSTLYADQFDFWVAEPTPARKAHQVVLQLVDQLKRGLYPDRKTLVIDPITDFLDGLEQAIILDMAQKGTNLETLSGMKKAQAYSQLNDRVRAQLDSILSLPLNVVFVARAKNVWGQVDGKMQPVGRQADAKDIVEYLCDVVLEVQKGGTARVLKSRLKDLPTEIPSVSYLDILRALNTSHEATTVAVPAVAQPVAVEDEAPALPDVEATMITQAQMGTLGSHLVRVFGNSDVDCERAMEWIRGRVERAIVTLAALTEAEAQDQIKALQKTKTGAHAAAEA